MEQIKYMDRRTGDWKSIGEERKGLPSKCNENEGT